MTPSPSPANPASHAQQRIAELFIRLQSLKEKAWRAHIAKRHDEALHLVLEMAETCQQLGAWMTAESHTDNG